MTAEPTKTPAQKHVLVVDDNVELAQTFQELLQLHGYQVSLAHEGVAALKMITQTDVDAILCDLSMPQLEGDMFHNAAAHVRPELTERFIFVTGNAENPKYEPFLKRINARVLQKPVKINDLLAALKALFERGEKKK
jgi:two-component system, sensor histidine kinase and response regulator